MKNWKPLFSSSTGEWETPDWLFKQLDEEFHFNLDVCATSSNTKIQKTSRNLQGYFSIQENGLLQSWSGYTCWMNPPYGRQVVRWVERAFVEAKKPETTVVCLLPARLDTGWFHDYLLGYSSIRLIRGRLRFTLADNPTYPKVSAPFPSMIAILSKDFVGTKYPIGLDWLNTIDARRRTLQPESSPGGES